MSTDKEDAERYRFLLEYCGFGIRKNGVIELSIAFNSNQPNHMSELNAAIDAARKEKT